MIRDNCIAARFDAYEDPIIEIELVNIELGETCPTDFEVVERVKSSGKWEPDRFCEKFLICYKAKRLLLHHFYLKNY